MRQIDGDSTIRNPQLKLSNGVYLSLIGIDGVTKWIR